MNSFFEKKYLFILSMWKLTLGYGTQKTIDSPTCYGPAVVVFFLEWQVFAMWSEIVFKNNKR
jgi:hypothetical protein